jgi:hypothetical protein
LGNVPSVRGSHWSQSLRAVFPTLAVGIVPKPEHGAWRVDLGEWCAPSLSFWEFDRSADEAMGGGATTMSLLMNAEAGPGECLGVLTRCQRWIGRRNRHTQGTDFDDVLRAHQLLYDVRKPLLLADYRHALDTWQWTLRLNADASAALQTAALFHDIERIASEPDVRIEHLATNYESFKTTHARRGSEMTRVFLRNVNLPAAQVERVIDLVARHETPASDADLALLNDADALSFFSLNSAGFMDYYGPAHTARKIRYTLARMRRSAVAELSSVRFRPDVGRLTWQALGASAQHPTASAP